MKNYYIYIEKITVKLNCYKNEYFRQELHAFHMSRHLKLGRP